MAEFILAQAARKDMLEICAYFDLESGSGDLGDRFLARAVATFEKLARTLGLGRPRKFKNYPEENLRSRQVDGFPKYLIFTDRHEKTSKFCV